MRRGPRPAGEASGRGGLSQPEAPLLHAGGCELNLNFEVCRKGAYLQRENSGVQRRVCQGAQLLCSPSPRVFGNSWDSDDDAPTKPQPQGLVPVVADSDGYCSHNENGTNGEPEPQRGTMTLQDPPTVATVSGGEGAWGREE